MDLELLGKKALVTGGSRGIGKAIVSQLELEGCSTIALSRGGGATARNELREFPQSGASLHVQADCQKLADLEEIKEWIVDGWGSLDLLIVNVGDGKGSRDPFPPVQEWSRLWDINFVTALNTFQALLPVLNSEQSSVVVVSSIAGLEFLDAPVAYSTAKAALTVLSQNLARRVGPSCRINVVAPGNILVPEGTWDQRRQTDPEGLEAFLRSRVPLRRLGSPSEIANCVAFLCSERSSFLTGQVVCVDGGQTSGFL